MRTTIEQLPGSQIREVANAGLGRDDVLAFWFGESDEVTPLHVREAATASLARGGKPVCWVRMRVPASLPTLWLPAGVEFFRRAL